MFQGGPHVGAASLDVLDEPGKFQVARARLVPTRRVSDLHVDDAEAIPDEDPVGIVALSRHLNVGRFWIMDTSALIKSAASATSTGQRSTRLHSWLVPERVTRIKGSHLGDRFWVFVTASWPRSTHVGRRSTLS
jgi:hypothetical protein